MAFKKDDKKKGSDSINLSEYLDGKFQVMQNRLTETRVFEYDSKFFPEITAQLKDLAALIGFDDYDPDTTASFTYVCTKKMFKFLAGPSIMSLGDQVVVVWAKKTFVVDSEDNIFAGNWRFSPKTDKTQALLYLDPKGNRLPVTISLAYMASEDEAKERDQAIADADTFGDLLPFLRSAIPQQPLKEILEVGESATVTELIRTATSEKSGKAYGIVEGTTKDGDTFRTYTLGELQFWEDNAYPMEITRTEEYTATVKAKGAKSVEEFSLGRNYIKLGELTEGEEYQVVGYEISTGGEYGPRAVLHTMIDKKIAYVSGNTMLNNYLTPGDVEITAENPATLHIDQIRTTKNNKKSVTCRLVVTQVEEDDFLAALDSMHAALA